MSEYKVGDKVMVLDSQRYVMLNLPCIGEITDIHEIPDNKITYSIKLENYPTSLSWRETSFRKLTPLDEVI